MSTPRPICLLLVEDDPLIRAAIGMLLEEDGFTVVEASSGQEAFRLLDAGLQADVVVTDVDLGAGPSGMDVADKLHREWPSVGVVFITGRDASLAGRLTGLREMVLAKPFEAHTLSAAVRRLAPR